MPELEQKLADKTAVIGIVGLGYVGLPLAVAFAEAGFRVIGFDIQAERVAAINSGKSFTDDIGSECLANLVTKHYLEATADQSRLREVDAIFICVPTPLNKTKDPELSYVTEEAEEVARYLQPGQLIVLESTTYPGTTRQVVLPVLERGGRKAGKDFYLAYSPERVDPGNRKYKTKNTPKLVGGIDAESTRLASLAYSQAVEKVLPVSSADVAEMTKVFENVFRYVNIALVNELSVLCEKMGISVWEVIDSAATKPFGYMPFYPGPGVGGHCIPIDPHYLSSKAKEYNFRTSFIELAAEINERMPYNIVSRLYEILNKKGKSIQGARLLVLGVAFKKDVGDVRESPSIELVHLLIERGAELAYNDPYVPVVCVGKREFSSVELTTERLSASDCVIIATDHGSYDYQFIVDNASTVFDTRGVTRMLKSGENIFRLGESSSPL